MTNLDIFNAFQAQVEYESTMQTMMDTEFLEAVALDSVFDAIKILEFNINAKTPNGRTVLIGASIVGRAEVVKYLIEKGADVNLKDNDGKTALDYAKDSETMLFLIRAGAEFGAKNESFWSKLFK